MYDPMRQVCIKYPEWLAEAKSQLTEEEYTRYGTQYQYFQRIVAVYETEPDNYPRLMEVRSVARSKRRQRGAKRRFKGVTMRSDVALDLNTQTLSALHNSNTARFARSL